jgi:replicative DNA helicase
LKPGELLLLGARPGQGKTLMGLRLAAQAAIQGNRAIFFTLEYTEQQVRDRLRRIGIGSLEQFLEIDCSDAINAGYVTAKLAVAPSGTLVVIDYLQLLDQKRDEPPLTDQVGNLRSRRASVA